jgi:ribosomal protein S21
MTAAMRKLSRLVTEEGLFNELRERQHFKSRTALRREREHAARRREQTRLMRQDRDLFGESPRGKTDAKKRPTTRTQASSQTELE